MPHALGHWRPAVSMRPLVVILLYIWAWTAFPPAYADQNPAPTEAQSFLRAARAAIAHGKVAEAEALARKRPGQDPPAAAVLAQIAIRKGKYDEAQALLEPAVGREANGEAALTLGMLYLELG